MAKKERYYEGTTSADTIVKDLAKVLCVGVQDDAIVDTDGTILKRKQLIKELNWDIVYPKPDLNGSLYDENGTAIVVQDKSNLSADEQLAKINQQIFMINNLPHNRTILKTKTTPVAINEIEATDSLGLENDLNKDSIEMYLEIYKPKNIIDLENYNPETEMKGIQPAVTTIQGFKESVSTTGSASINVYEMFEGTDKIQEEPKYKTLDTPIVMSLSGGTTYNNLRSPNNSIGKLYNEIADEFSISIYEQSLNAQILTDVLYGSLEGNKKIIVDKIAAYAGYNYTEKDKISIRINGKNTNTNSTLSFIKTYITKQEYQEKFSIKEYDPATQEGFFLKVEEEDPKNFIIESSNGDLTSKFVYDEAQKILYSNFDIPNAGGSNNPAPFDNLNGYLTISYEYKKEKSTLKQTELVENHHHIFIRIFDKLNENGDGPAKRSSDSHVSEWSKLSWYKDFEEIAVDELDEDPGTDDISKGVVNLPTVTPGLNGSTRIQFWVNTSNDTVSLVVMGNPSLEFGSNKHISSFAYIGRVKSFENSINDTAGNFALATSSTTVPCLSQTNTRVKTDEVKIETIEDGIKVLTAYSEGNEYVFNVDGTNEFNYELTPKVVIFPQDGDGNPDLVNGGELERGNYEIELPNTLGENKIKVTLISGKYMVPVGNYIGITYYTNKNIIETSKGAVRDGLGNMIEINLPQTYGINTATGVTDISMLHTRSKAFFQQHHLMFTTTNEYMKKEQYGKSAYTSEYYADRAKITHGNDGPRGMLKNILIIDTSSLVALDELVINRDHLKEADEPEETFVYFPITAPYSPLTSGPNSMYGIAIKKEEKLPAPENDAEAVSRAFDDLFINDASLIKKDILLPETGIEGTTIEWLSSDPDHFAIIDSSNELNEYDAITIGDVTQPEYSDTLDNDAEVTLTATISKGDESVEKIFKVVVKESGVGNDAAVTIDAAWIDLPEQTNQNLSLPAEGPNDTTITWESSNESVLTSGGIITRPPNDGSADELVTLTATVSKGLTQEDMASTEIEFQITVLAWTNSDELAEDYSYLAANCFDEIKSENNSISNILTDLDLNITLPHGSTIAWASSKDVTDINIDSGINPNTGEVVRPGYLDVSTASTGLTVNLTATLTSKDTVETKTYQLPGLIVVKKDKTDADNIYNATTHMTDINTLVGYDSIHDVSTSNTSISDIKEDFTLPSGPKAEDDALGATFNWYVCDETGDNIITSAYISIGTENTTNSSYPVSVTRPESGELNQTVYIKRVTSSQLYGALETQEDVYTLTVKAL